MEHNRIPWDGGVSFAWVTQAADCNDCGASPGELHKVPWCDMEVCAKHNEQAISCSKCGNN